MEKNTILAVILSTVVLIGFYAMQGVFFPPKPVQTEIPSPVTAVVPETVLPQTAQQATAQQAAAPVSEPPAVQQTASQQQAAAQQSDLDAGPQEVELITIDTELITVVLTNAGGNVVSWKLKEHLDKEEYVDMILPGTPEYEDMVRSGTQKAQAFSVAFGGIDAQPVTSLFYVNRLSEYSIEFYRDFSSNADGKFRLIKRYDFKPKDYMFELAITLDGGYSMSGFNFGGSAYTLTFGPQIGPKFEKLDNRYDYRHYITYANGKRKNAKVNDIIDTRPAWAAISGKYFSFIAIPYLAQYNITFSDKPEQGIASASRLSIIRPAISASKATDTYRFYLGPKTQEALAVYNTGNNLFGLKDTQLVEVASSRGILSPLEKALKWLLLIFYKIAPNYGIAIILLTLFIKILFFPLTKKGSEATLRMQALAPKIKEIQEKYKSNPQKQQAEMANFYKQEGYNPLSGCLPMLLQIPIFIAMYNLFNNHFDLRGAEFIPGWIPDLSLPEYIWNFPDGFKLPIFGWTALRALPFIYVGSQLIYGKVTQNPGQQQGGQMKMMLYVMPIVFFFVLYNVPSGLLIYWIFSNILTLVQQLIINRYIKAKKEEAVIQPAEKPIIAPPRKKKR
ncbi:MAG: membrane protein insertase YidC [Treponema sp.]|jgi:YidC/Oxa1 family membrane protein insertase|nr:membrane protein insertase YidC [Treponema sp.]